MEQKFTIKEALEVIAKHMKDLTKGDVLPFKPREMGKTSSGKTVYHKDHPSHKDFTSADHKEAAKMHQDAMKAMKNPGKDAEDGFKTGQDIDDSDRTSFEHHGKRLAAHSDAAKGNQ